jgi:hypothetical protein
MKTHVQEVEDGSHDVAGVDITSRESVAGDVTRRGRHGHGYFLTCVDRLFWPYVEKT